MGGRPAAAITGLGMTDLGRVYGSSQRHLAMQAVRLAAADAGLALGDLDGLLICPGISGGLDIGLATALGLRDLSLLAVITSYGASACAAVQVAAQAVSGGSATAVACVFADTPLREAEPAGTAFGSAADPGDHAERRGLSGLAAGYGYRSITAHYALAARRHMAAYGTTSEQLGAVAVAQRHWAAGNPRAQLREPITVADHQRSRFIAEPLHLLDCSLVSNGAIAVIVASAGRARAAPKPPVRIWGFGQGHPGHPMRRGGDFGLVTGAVQAGRAALRMAGVTAADITMCQLYDCYTYTVLVTLEDYGFCPKGDGGPFAASGALAPGGRLPVNTGGGQLSGYYMWGFTPLSEAVIQARGDGGQRQAGPADLILVSGNGGILGHHGTLIVSPHQPGRAGVLTSGRTAKPAPGTPGRAAPPARATPAAPAAGSMAIGTAEPGPASSRAPGTRPAARTNPVPGPAPATAPQLPGFATSTGVIRSDGRSAPFFAAAARDELLARHCTRCALWLAPPAGHCPACGEAQALAWATASGHGTLVSWTVIRSRQGDPVAVPALVELAEGPWLHTALQVNSPAELASVKAGQRVTAVFIHPANGESYPMFRVCTDL